MENIGEMIKDAIKAWRERWGSKPALLVEKFKQGLRESPQVRAATAVIVAACCLGGFFWLQDDGTDVGAAANHPEPVAVMQANAKKGDRLEVSGADEALGKEPLRNPFLPNHPTREESRQMRTRPAKNTENNAAGKGAKAAGTAGQQAPITGMPISVPVRQAVEKEQKQVYLQGIIDTEGSPGALLTLEGQTRFLLAGESWQGYVLESVSGDEAAVNGHMLHIGDTVAM